MLWRQPIGDTYALADAVAERFELQANAREWTNSDELLARVLEFLSLMRIEALAIGGARPHTLPKRISVPRPGAEPEGPVVVSPREASRMMVSG